MKAIMLLVAIASAGCLRNTTFKCDQDSECAGAGADPRCTGGFCTFADSSCTVAGRRYADNSGTSSGQCVGEGDDRGGNEPPIDMMGGEPLPTGCPATGYMTLAGAGTNMYKLINTDRGYIAQRDACAAEMTYLAIPNNTAELMAITGLNGSNKTWVGINDIVTEGSYQTSLNMPAVFLPWANGEPDNNGNQDCVAGTGMTISTEDCGQTFKAVCECTP